MHSQRMGALICLLLSMLIALCPAALPLHAVAEEENVIYYIEPELPSDVEPYDPEHPEDLYEDQLYAKSAILIEASSGEVIFEKNADATMYPASTTKIMTVLLGIMMGDMNQTVYLSQTAADIGDDSSDMGLDVGESINFKDLLYGTMVRSANEGANLIAETLYGSVPAFAEVMNEAAAMYGCTGTPNEGLKIDPVEQARRIREAEENDPMLKGRVIQGVADPAIFNESQGESIAQMQEKHPYYLVWHPGDHTRLAGKMQMHYRLAFDAEGRPMLQVFDTCKHFIRTIPNLVYDESNVEDIDSDQEDHIYDECRYVLMENPLSPRQIQKETVLRDDPLDLDSHKSRTRVMRV